MLLYYSVNSPYARKCRAVIIEKHLEAKVELERVDALSSPPQLLAVNPLGKVPALSVTDTLHLCDSPLICEYLDALPSDTASLYPQGEKKYPVLALAALADGLMDAAVELTLQNRRPEHQRWPDWVERKHQAILRTLETVAKHPLPGDEILNIGTLSLACALAYLHFRHPQLQWEHTHPQLDTWLAHVLKRPSFEQTQPEG